MISQTTSPSISQAWVQRLCVALQTPRLTLEPLRANHAQEVFAALQDDALYQWISNTKPVSVEALSARWLELESRLSPDQTEAWPIWMARRHSGGACLGRVDVVLYSQQLASNVGYYLFPPHWGQGYASEAVQAVCAHLDACGVQEYRATVTVGNLASARVLQKASFRYTRRIPDNDRIRGVPHDDDEYVRLAT